MTTAALPEKKAVTFFSLEGWGVGLQRVYVGVFAQWLKGGGEWKTNRGVYGRWGGCKARSGTGLEFEAVMCWELKLGGKRDSVNLGGGKA